MKNIGLQQQEEHQLTNSSVKISVGNSNHATDWVEVSLPEVHLFSRLDESRWPVFGQCEDLVRSERRHDAFEVDEGDGTVLQLLIFSLDSLTDLESMASTVARGGRS